MISFDNYPDELKVDDYTLSCMTLDDLQQLFIRAKALLLVDDFKYWQTRIWSAIERVRNNPSRSTMQTVVEHLEEYKRRLGRQYSASYSIRTALKYNEVERDIRFLCKQYEVVRKSKPYFLGPRY